MNKPAQERIKVVRLLPVLDFGGVESRIVLQSQLMPRDKFDFRVCAFWRPGAAAEKIRALGVTVDILGEDPSIRNPRALAALYQYLRQEKPDVLHASIGEAMFHGSLAGLLAGVPVRLIEEVGMPARAPAAKLAFSGLSRIVNGVIGVSQATCDYLIEQEKMPRDRVKLVYNCGKPQYFGPLERQWAVTDRPFRLFTAGRLVPVKNQKVLIAATGKLLDAGLDVELWIAGEGESRGELEAQIKSLGLEERVKLLGFRQDIDALLLQTDAFILSSYTEGCSVALVEAMATATPVVGSTADGIKEVMGELGAQWLNAPDDLEAWVESLRALVALDAPEREALGLKGHQIAHTRFSPEVYMRNLTSLYAQEVGR